MDNYPTARPSVRAFGSSYGSTVASATSLASPSVPVNYGLKSVSFCVLRDANATDPPILDSPKAVADLVTNSGIIADEGVRA